MARVIHKEDCEIIEVPNLVKLKVTTKGSGGTDKEAIARAEEALKLLSVRFDDWIEDEINNLTGARDAVRAHGLASPHGDDLFRVAHDIKGQGETLGYPMAAAISASLCKLMERVEDRSIIPMDLIEHHVDAIRRVMRDGIKDMQHPTGRAVLERLEEVVHEFVEHVQGTDSE